MAVSTPQAIKKTVTEAVSACITSDRLDESACVVKGAKVVGLKSAHGYEYTNDSIARAKNLYEGAPVYVGHSAKGRNGSYGERIAVVRNFEARADGGYADIHYNPKHPLAEQFVHDVKNNPDKLGFSHHAETMQRRAGGKTVVEAIERVHSVDLVNAPATTRGVFESLDSPETPMPTTLKAVLEAIPAETFGRTALETLMGDGGGYSADMPVDVADGMSADGQAKAAFRSMVMAAFDDESLDAKATLAKIKAILKAQDDIAGAGAGGSAGGSAGGNGGSGDSGGDKSSNPEKKEAKEAMTETPEQIKAERDRLKREVEVRNLIAAEKRTATESQVKACVALEAEADRKAFVNDLPKADAKVGSGVQKPGRSSSVLESAADGGPVEPPKFASNEERIAFLRG